jgi:hypothetical protein
MAKSAIKGLSDRRAKTAGVGKHLDRDGLYLRVTLGGGGVLHRYWLFRYADRTTGKDRQLGLGNLNTVSLARAREAAQECRALLLQGKDPIVSRRAQKASHALADATAMTFGQCADAYITSHRAGWSNVKHADQWVSSLATYVLPTLGHLPVDAIDTSLVLHFRLPFIRPLVARR